MDKIDNHSRTTNTHASTINSESDLPIDFLDNLCKKLEQKCILKSDHGNASRTSP